MGRALDPKKIKSAQRVLEVLEFFSAERQEGTVMDIARAYGYPQSSTSELLSCLVALGYLHRDLRARTYRPSTRVAVLGAWVQPHLFRQGHVLPMMDELANAAEATVVLGSQIGLGVQYFHVVDPLDGGGDLRSGQGASLMHSAPGRVLLSVMDREQVRKLNHRLNAESDEALRMRFSDLSEELDRVRAQGYAIAPTDNGMAMISVLLPDTEGGERLALSIQVAADRVAEQEDQLVSLLRATVSRHLGLSAVDPALPTGLRPPVNQNLAAEARALRWAG